YKMQINGKYVIDCHHTNPLATTGKINTELGTLVCLCPNCHRVAHLKRPPYTVAELKELIFA
ncbi:TPA: HNH endonuclease, partial [Vibrio cholerae]|nr:HNH endonuclease [Vibrio cholerae]HDZ3774848.1 HNH endonuclease [Vibrio cholerae]